MTEAPSNHTRQLRDYLRGYYPQLALGLVLVAAAVAINLSLPFLTRFAVDDLNAERLTGRRLLIYIALFISGAAVSAVISLWMRRIPLYLSHRIGHAMRADLFAHLTTMDAAFFRTNRTGDIMTRMSSDLSQVRTLVGQGIFQGARTLFVFSFAFVIMFGISVPLALVLLILLPTISAAVFLLLRIARPRYEAGQHQFSALSNFAQERFAGIRTIKGFALEERQEELFADINREFVRRQMALSRIDRPAWPLMAFLFGVGHVVILVAGGRLVLEGRLTLGEMVQFNQYLMVMGWPMMALGWTLNLLMRGRASWQRIRQLLEAQPGITDGPQADPSLLQASGDIVFDDVTLVMDGRRLLEEVNLTIPAGATVGITGPTGSGKSLLVSLLARFADPTEGAVSIGGPRCSASTPGGAAPRHQHGAPGAVSLLRDPGAQHRLRAGATRRVGHHPGLGHRPAHPGCRPLPRSLRDGAGRRRRDPLRRTTAAHGHQPGGGPRSADPHSRRRALGGGHPDRGADPGRAARRGAPADGDLGESPRQHPARGGPYRGARGRAGGRPGHPRRTDPAPGLLPGPRGGPAPGSRPGGLRVSRPLATEDGKGFKTALTRRLIAFVRPYRLAMAAALVVMLGMALSLNGLPVLIKRAIDQYLTGEIDPAEVAVRYEGIVRIGLLYLLLSGIGAALRFGQGYLMAWVGQRIVSDLRLAIFRKILRLPPAFFDRTPVGRLMTRVTSDVESMQRLVTDGLVGLAADVFMLLVTTGFMVYLSPRLTLTLFTVLPPLCGGLGYVQLPAAPRAPRRAPLPGTAQQLPPGSPDRHEPPCSSSTARPTRETASGATATPCAPPWTTRRGGSAYYYPSLEVMRGLATALVLGVGGWVVLRGGEGVTLGMLVAFLAYIRTFFRPLEDLSEKSSMFQQAMASCERIFGLHGHARGPFGPAGPLGPVGRPGETGIRSRVLRL